MSLPFVLPPMHVDSTDCITNNRADMLSGKNWDILIIWKHVRSNIWFKGSLGLILVIGVFSFLSHFSSLSRKKLAIKISFLQIKNWFLASWESSQKKSTLCKTCYFISKKVLAEMVSVDSDSWASMPGILCTFIKKATRVVFTNDWGRLILILWTPWSVSSPISRSLLSVFSKLTIFGT